MKKLTRNFVSSLSMVAVLSVISCGSPDADTTETVEVVETPVVEEVTVVEMDLIMVHEDGFAHQHGAEISEAKMHAGHDHGDHDHAHAQPQKMSLANSEAPAKTADVTTYMQSRSFETIEVDTTEDLMLPKDVNQTLISFDKDANFEGQVHVISSNETGEVQTVIFTGKHHMDEYNVAAGLTGKEARHLRKDLKHMTKHGRIFLYEEGSNIVYLMDAKDVVTGEEIQAEDIDNMVIEAVLLEN